MASDQVSRRENTTTERDIIYIEKDRVPKMTTHFESLAEKTRDSDVAAGKETAHDSTNERTGNLAVADVFGADQNARERHEFESLAGKVGDMNVSAVIVAKTEEENQKQKGQELKTDKAEIRSIVGEQEAARKGKEKQLEGMTRGPFAIGKFEVSAEEERGSSIQSKGSSMRMAGKEENSAKENDKAAKLGGREEGSEQPEQLSLEEISKLRAQAQQNATDTIRAAEERYSKVKESASQGLKTVAEYAKEKGAEAKETALQSTQYATEKGEQAKDSVRQAAQQAAEKFEQTKDTVLHGAQHVAVQAKDTAVDVSKNIASYAGEKAVATKDVTIERGKEAAELAGKVAVDVKDKAVVAGWSAAHYATEKAVEGTKVATRVVDGVAEYAGHKEVEIAAKPLGAAKEAAAAAGESMMEYTARKMEEAERELEAKRSTQIQDTEKRRPDNEKKEQETRVGKEAKEQMEEVARTVEISGTDKTFDGSAAVEEEEERETGVLGAIAETIMEIAQTTMELVIGTQPHQQITESFVYRE